MLIYILQSALSIAIFYMFYVLVFRKEGYFRFNRYYLLLAVSVSLLLPFFQFKPGGLIPVVAESGFTLNPVHDLMRFTLDEVVITANGVSNETSNIVTPGFSFLSITLYIYIIGVVIASLIFLIRLIRMWSLVRSNPKVKRGNLVCVITKEDTPAFSFLNYIFIDKRLMSDKTELEKIIGHELSHIRNWHSYDLLFVELMQIIQWFNPVFHLLKKAIKENHEFMADNDVVSGYTDPMEYGRLLMEHSTQIKSFSIAHNFSYSLLKRRLMMINKVKNPVRFSFKLLWVLVALNLVFFACSGPDTETFVEQNDIQQDKQAMDNNTETTEFDVFTVVEDMPEYHGGMQALMEYLGSNIVYPESAKEKGIEGRVLINFIVDTDGSIKSVNVIRGIYEDCDNEAVRVVSSMPKWKPGKQKGVPVKVSYNLPIKFTLQDSAKDTIYDVVDVMPEYSGGKKEMFSYLSNNIKYPEAAIRKGVTGRVFVSFVVEKDGRINNAKIIRGIGSGCDEEALRVVNAMPNWTPGKNKNGEPVRVKFNLPIKFALN